MINASELLTLAKARRDLANRARRWAAGLTAEADKARLNRYSEELDQLAADLERQAAEPGRGVVSWPVTKPKS